MKKKILIVDDNPDVVELLQVRLRANGYETLTALNGEEGVAHARKHRPDFIILDIMMPEVDGPEVARRLQEDEHTKDIPYIFLTNIISQNEQQEFGGAGANRIVAKLNDWSALLVSIREYIEAR